MNTITNFNLKTFSSEQTKQIAFQLASLLQPNDALLLTGDLGAGKTQFTQGLAAGLGISAEVTSPTFTIMCVYENATLPLYHFDLYRLEDETELEDIGFYEMVEADGVSCIEWGDKFPEEMPEDLLIINITVGLDEVRSIEVSAQGDRAHLLMQQWQEKIHDYK